MKRSPRKPSTPLVTIVFRGGGRVTQMIAEPLPEVKEDLELAIVVKFLNGLRAEGRDIGPPTRGPDWPDAVAQIDGAHVGIEVVEVIDPDHAQRRATQEQYLQVLLPLLQDLEAQLDGVALTVVDGYQEPRWPSVASSQGQRLVRFISQKLRNQIGELAAVKSRPTFYPEWDDFEDSKFRLGVMAMRGRRISGAPAAGLDLRFSGTFPIGSERLNGLLTVAVEGKIRKSYERYRPGQLWLLAYGQDHSIVEVRSTERVRVALSTKPHPFDAVWAFFPFPGRGGETTRIFPT